MVTDIATKLIRRIAGAGGALCAIVVLGTGGFWIITGMRHSLLDCAYMTVITVTTIGFGEVIDLSDSPGGRVFTIFLAIAGVGTATYLLSNFTAFVVEGELSQAFRRRAMEKMAKRLKDHYIVCGIGKVGLHIVQELWSTQRPCVVLDIDSASLQEVTTTFEGIIHFEADATENDTLIAAGIATARGLFAVADDDNQNLVIVLTAKQLNPQIAVVTRCREIKNTEKLKTAGADAIISPALIGGLRMVSEMIRPTAVSFLDIMLRDKNKNLRIEEIPVALAGKKLAELELHRFPETLLLAIRTKSEWIFNPPPDHVLDVENKLVVMTSPDERAKLQKVFGSATSGRG